MACLLLCVARVLPFASQGATGKATGPSTSHGLVSKQAKGGYGSPVSHISL